MTTLRKGTPLYDAVFAGVTLLPFDSKGPNYTRIVNAYLDPSNRKIFNDPAVTNAAQASDMRSGMQNIVNALAVGSGTEDGVEYAIPNLPSGLIPGVRSILASADIDVALPDLGVAKVFDAAASGNAVGVAGALLGLGMGAIGVSFPVVGWIGAVIVGVTTGIYSALHAQKVRLEKENKEHRAMLYRAFPPLQIGDAETDGDLVSQVLLPDLKKRDWTRIYQPRFDSEMWVGVERQGGYAFAPGTLGPNPDVFGDGDAFTPSGGLGVIPGTTQVTAVIQVSLVHDPDDGDASAWLSFLKGGRDPRGIGSDGINGWTRVQDTGVYFPATGRLAGAMWSLAMAKGSPYKYRLDTLRLHDRWRRWAEGGLRYIREVCYPWWPSVSDGNGKIKVGKDTNFEGFYGTGIFYSVGAWAGVVDKKKSTTQNLVYKTWPKPDGTPGPELVNILNAYGAVGSPVSSTYSGAFLPILDPARWPDQCMGTIYDRATNIKATLDQLQAAQRWELEHTLVSASVSVRDAAFVGDPKLMALLLKVREKLITSEDRFYIDITDVADDEPGLGGRKNADSWRKQLIASGVPANPTRAAHGLLRLAPSNAPPPPKPPFHEGTPNPWDPRDMAVVAAPKLRKRSSGAGMALGLGLGGLGVALATGFALRQRRRRGFSAGRAS